MGRGKAPLAAYNSRKANTLKERTAYEPPPVKQTEKKEKERRQSEKDWRLFLCWLKIEERLKFIRSHTK